MKKALFLVALIGASSQLFCAAAGSQDRLRTAILANNPAKVRAFLVYFKNGLQNQAQLLIDAIDKPEILEILLANEVDPNARSVQPGTPTALHLAARSGYKDAVDILLQYGADKTIVNDQGKTALDLAITATIADLLRDSGRKTKAAGRH